MRFPALSQYAAPQAVSRITLAWSSWPRDEGCKFAATWRSQDRSPQKRPVSEATLVGFSPEAASWFPARVFLLPTRLSFRPDGPFRLDLRIR